MRMPLGTAWIAQKGWASPEVEAVYLPALQFASSFGGTDVSAIVQQGLAICASASGRAADSMTWIQPALEAATKSMDLGVLLTTHSTAMALSFWKREIC